MKALSALAKFSGCHERYRRMIKSYGLKWSTNNDDIIIARLIKYSNGINGNANDLFEWVRTVKEKIPAFSTFMDFVIATGLRLDEAIKSYSLIVKLAKQGKLNEYYDSERQVLEHFKFKELFIRRTKKTFMSFVSKELIDQAIASGLEVSQDVIRKRMQRAKFKLRFSDLRELWASRSIKNLRQPEIDFLQGRVSASVFMRNYFNPTWIVDLKRRALKNADKLLSQVDKDR
jgi:intergrase/recombinase